MRPGWRKASGYFYFWTGEAADWIDRTVQVTKISALRLDAEAPWVYFRDPEGIVFALKQGRDWPV